MAVLGPARFSLKLALVTMALCLCIAFSAHSAMAADDASKAAADKAEASSKGVGTGTGTGTGDRDLTLNANGALSSTPDNSNSNSNDNSNGNAISLSGSGDNTSTSSDNKFGISLNNNDNNNDNSSSNSDSTPSKSTSGSKATTTSSGSSNGQPGRIVMKTPPQSVESPLFEIASKVKLQWDYDNNMKSPPSQITIRGQMPSGYFQPGTTKPLYWFIAQNVSASPKTYTWDTITQSPPGYTLREGTGYKLFIYDSNIGWENSTHVYPGKLFQFMLPFSMYNSRYSQSNDGVPKNYNPNAGSRSASVTAGAWTALLAALVATFAI